VPSNDNYWKAYFEYANGYYLKYSTQASTLPIVTSTISSATPCVKPSEAPIGLGTYYPTEADFAFGGCTEAKINGLTNDDRFFEYNIGATEYDVQSYSNVLNILRAQPMSYDTYLMYGGID
jgi:hypothetical protein